MLLGSRVLAAVVLAADASAVRRAVVGSGDRGGSSSKLNARQADTGELNARKIVGHAKTVSDEVTVAGGGATADDTTPLREQRQLTQGQCFDTDDGAADPYGDACDGYAAEAATGWSSGYGNWCGNYDDSDFSSNDMCCACGGSASPTGGGETAAVSGAIVDGAPPRAHRQLTLGQCPATCYGYTCDHWTNTCADLEDNYGCVCAGCDCITAAPSVSVMPSASPAPTGAPTFCYDTDNGASDSELARCDYPYLTSWCGYYDDSDFTANDMCCVCGGGSANAFPTEAPTITDVPSTSPAPTSLPIQATTYGQIRMPIANMEEGDELEFDLALDLTFPNQIILEGDRSVKLAGDTAGSRPTLSGGSSGTRFFAVLYEAVLELKYLVLADGYAQSVGDNDGGATIVWKATLILIDCILRDSYSVDKVRRLRVARRGGSVGASSLVARSEKKRLPCAWMVVE